MKSIVSLSLKSTIITVNPRFTLRGLQLQALISEDQNNSLSYIANKSKLQRQPDLVIHHLTHW